jgi:hypothetical protein
MERSVKRWEINYSKYENNSWFELGGQCRVARATRPCVDLNHKLFDDSWNTCGLLEKPLTVSSNFPLRAGGDIWKESGEDAERGKKRADVVDEVDAGVVGKLAQQCGADTA